MFGRKKEIIITEGFLRKQDKRDLIKELAKSKLIAITTLDKALHTIYAGMDVSFIEYYEEDETGVYVRRNIMKNTKYRIEEGDRYFVTEIAARVKEIVTNHHNYVVVMEQDKRELKDYLNARP